VSFILLFTDWICWSTFTDCLLVSLPADINVWLASEEAAFLKDKYIFANWDVEELKARKEEIVEKKLFEMWLQGVPFEVEA
jgi:hypothetical protein